MSDESERINHKLYSNGNATGYGDNALYHSHLLEQYKLYQSSAENISSRRQTANSFFVSINTAVIGLASYLNFGSSSPNGFYWLIALGGISISYMWYRLIRSYRDLNGAKFKVIYEIEKSLPIRPYDAEWEAVGRGKNSTLYLPFTHIEILVPWVFIGLHTVGFLYSFPWGLIFPCVHAS